MYELLKRTKYAALFFCAFTVLMGSLPWLVHGIRENSLYKRHEGRVTAISEFAPSSNIFSNGVPVNEAEAQYVYYFEDGSKHQDSFIILDWENDGGGYSVGDEYIVYTKGGWSEDISESSAESHMKFNIIFPLIFIVPSFAAALAGAVMSGELPVVCRIYPKSSIFSVLAFVISAYEAVYALFIFDGGIFMGGLAEAMRQLGAIVLCAVFVIAEIVIWCIAAHRKKKMILASEGENEAYTG